MLLPNGGTDGKVTARISVEARGIVKVYGTGSEEVRALDRVDVQIRTGEFFTLLGPSGCGKTTLLRMIAGFETPTEGDILLDGRDITVDDAFKRREHDGPIAGDEIIAQFAFPDGVHATWTSRHALRGHVGNWAIELHGSAGAARINCDTPPRIYVSRKSALLFGTEKKGLSPELMAQADVALTIPMYGFTESLNISVSAAIILNELVGRMRREEAPWALSPQERYDLECAWTVASIKDAPRIIERYNQENA